MHRFSYRQLVIATAFLGVLAAGALVLGLVADVVELVAVALFLGPAAAAVYVTLQVRRVRQLTVRLERQLSDQLTDVVTTVRQSADVTDVARTLRELVVGEHRRTVTASEQIGTEIKNTVRTRGDYVASREFAELEAFVDLRQFLSPRAPMPPTRGWAASPDVLRTLVELILDHRPDLVVECGSGASSIWIGYILERLGHGKLVSLEHDEGFAAISSSQVRRHGLSNVIEIRLAPLEPWAGPGGSWHWYSLDILENLHDVGLVFVDGPPGGTQRHARYPAVPVLLAYCTTDAVFVLDDANREDEREIGERWLAEFPELRRCRLRHEKGCDVFVRTAD